MVWFMAVLRLDLIHRTVALRSLGEGCILSALTTQRKASRLAERSSWISTQSSSASQFSCQLTWQNCKRPQHLFQPRTFWNAECSTFYSPPRLYLLKVLKSPLQICQMDLSVLLVVWASAAGISIKVFVIQRISGQRAIIADCSRWQAIIWAWKDLSSSSFLESLHGENEFMSASLFLPLNACRGLIRQLGPREDAPSVSVAGTGFDTAKKILF